MPAGRPTKYKPEYCREIIEFMRDGASVVEFAASIDVSKQTIYHWASVHEPFSDSLKQAMSMCEAWWTEKGRAKLEEPKFNHVLWYMQMKNRFKWRDRQEVEHSGTIEGNLVIVRAGVDVDED